MINQSRFEMAMRAMQSSMQHLAGHSRNQLAAGMAKPYVAQYEFILAESERLYKWAGLQLREASARTRTPQNFLTFYGEVAVMNHNYNTGIEEQIKGRGNFDFVTHTEGLLLALQTCLVDPSKRNRPNFL